MGTVGGLGLFLFGMSQMSDGLKKVAAQRLKSILEAMTRNRITGFLVGSAVTAVIQSSSAATVMVVGFVNAGLLTLRQAISVIIGTNVGTTATAWLVSISGFENLKITSYALPAVTLGFVLQYLGRRRRAKDLGQILLGFGLLFIGLNFMKNAFAGLEQSEGVRRLFVSVADSPVLALLCGMGVTMLIQSSSAAVAAVQLLAVEGAFGVEWQVALAVAIPFILGSNIGTTITAQLAALQTNANARRAAWAHTMFNVVGALIFYWFIKWIAEGVYLIAPWELGPATIAASIALAHSILKVLDAIIFLPFVGALEKLANLLVRLREGERAVPTMVLEKHLLSTPPIALAQARREIASMVITAKDAIGSAVSGFREGDTAKLQKARDAEDVLDKRQYEITTYLVALSEKQLSSETSDELPVLLHTVNDLERVGDLAVNIAEIAERKREQKIVLSSFAQDELDQLEREVGQMLDLILDALEANNREKAKESLANEENLNRMQIEFRRNHVDRMSNGQCTAEAGLVFIDLVDNMEKIGDHLTNIAQAVLGGLQWDGAER
jgi:phosphate:Na+ symporter